MAAFQIRKVDLRKHPKLAKWYSDYLQSDKWHAFCLKIYEKRGKVCQGCALLGIATTEFLCIHHLTYENVTRELQRDVLILCKDCHALTHTHRIIPYAERIYDEYYDPKKNK